MEVEISTENITERYIFLIISSLLFIKIAVPGLLDLESKMAGLCFLFFF